MQRTAKVLFLILLTASLAHAQAWSGILNSARAIDWSTAGLLGSGGIPSGAWTQSGSTIASGATSATIQTALNACGTNHFVLLGVGTFSASSTISIPSNCELRGSGPNKTILNSTVSGGPVITLGSGGAAFAMSGAKNVLSGATSGSTVITVAHADITAFSVGQYMGMDELNSGNVTAAGDEGVCSSCSDIGQGGTRAKGIMLEITAVDSTANTITFNPALPIDFSHTPHALAFNVTKHAGVELLQVFANNTGASANFTTNGCAYCWVQGVEGNYADGVHVYMNWSFHSQVTDSYFSNAFTHSPGTDAVVQLGYRSTGNLVQNNILERLHSSLIIEQGAVGNVIAYNYGQGDFDQAAPNAIFSGVDFHGANPMFNLIEGNIVTSYGADNVWGSHGPNTAFRNWSRGTSLVCNPTTNGRNAVNCVPTGTFAQQAGKNSWYQFQAAIAINLPYETWNFNEVGNVTGSPEQAALRNTANGAVPNHDSIWAVCAGGGTPCGAGSRPYGTNSYTYAYGYGATSDDGSGTGCAGGTAPCHAQLPWTTLFLHGDYDYNTNVITWSGAITHTLPASFYLAAKPSWWSSDPYPGIGPDLTGGTFARGFANNNPAKRCYETVMGGDGGTGSPYTFDPSVCYANPAPPPPPPPNPPVMHRPVIF